MALKKYSLPEKPRNCVISPYKEIEEFPDELDKAWRDVAFQVVYPTMKLLNHLDRQSIKMRQGKEGNESFTYREIDLPALAKYICHTIIQGWEGVYQDDGVSEEKYDPEWLYWHFDRFPWLFNRFMEAYRNLSDVAKKEREKEEQDFLST
jgi:hypothetical protein